MEKIIYFGVPIALIMGLFVLFGIFMLIGRILNRIKKTRDIEKV